MAILTIRTPPDGDDLSTGAETRFLALLPVGVTPKEAILRLVWRYIRFRELHSYAEAQSAEKSTNIVARRNLLETDPDLGTGDLP